MTTALWRIATPDDAGAIHPIRTAVIGSKCSELPLRALLANFFTLRECQVSLKLSNATDQMKLLKPSIDYISAYVSALQKGWSPNNLRSEAAHEELASITKDAVSFVSTLDDPTAKAGPVILPDGSEVPRLPSVRRWIWDDEFCGHISLRWKPGTEELPPTCSGHIGYGVVPWRQGEGLASAALVAILPEAKAVGLKYVEITTSPDNPASVRVIEKAGGTIVRTYTADKALGGHETLEYKILLI